MELEELCRLGYSVLSFFSHLTSDLILKSRKFWMIEKWPV